MELPVILLAATVIAIGAIGWWRERRTWQTVYATTARDPAQAVELHRQLRGAGIRSRYKLSHGGIAFHQAHSALNQTAEVKVHRDDLHRAYEVRAQVAPDRG